MVVFPTIKPGQTRGVKDGVTRKRITKRDIKSGEVAFTLQELYDPIDNTYKFLGDDGVAIMTIDPVAGTLTMGKDLLITTNVTITGNLTASGTNIFAGTNTFGGDIINDGVMVKLSTQTASSSSSIDFTTNIDSTYDEHVFRVTGATAATDDVSFGLRYSFDGGSTYKADSFYDHGRTQLFGTGGQFQGASLDEQIDVENAIGNASTETFNSNIFLYKPSTSGTHKIVNFWGVHKAEDENVVGSYGIGQYTNATGAVNAVRFLMSSGNIATGTFTHYGRKRT